MIIHPKLVNEAQKCAKQYNDAEMVKSIKIGIDIDIRSSDAISTRIMQLTKQREALQYILDHQQVRQFMLPYEAEHLKQAITEIGRLIQYIAESVHVFWLRH